MRNQYIFVDESGNFDFSEKGTRFLTLTCIITERPFGFYKDLHEARYDLIEYGIPVEAFHCAGDNKHIRARIFQLIQNYQIKFGINSLIVEKNKIGHSLQKPETFYTKLLGYLIGHVFNDYPCRQAGKIVIVTDTIPIQRKRKAIEKSIKVTLAQMLPKDTRLTILHHTAKAHYGLQVTDYCSWSIFRKWEYGDEESYKLIKPAIQSEFEVFLAGM